MIQATKHSLTGAHSSKKCVLCLVAREIQIAASCLKQIVGSGILTDLWMRSRKFQYNNPLVYSF